MRSCARQGGAALTFVFHRPVLAVAFLIVFWAPGHEGHADTATPPCSRILDDRARLACYDKASQSSDERRAPEALSLGAGAAAMRGDAGVHSMIDGAWAFGPDSGRYALRYFRPNYVLPARYTDDVNQEPFSPLFGAAESEEQLDPLEARYQISFKSRVWATDDRRWGVWLAYTQQTQWQVYSEAISRPFRETNYEPEAIISFRPDVRLGNFDFRLLNVGFNHQSNGRAQVLSRSWDRVYAEAGLERDRLAILAKAWYRIPESSNRDDNPDINRYMGYGELTGVYTWRDHSYSLMLRGNWNTGKGAARFSWMTPQLFGLLRGYVQVFSGYGDSMIDYNWNQNAIGIGIALNDIL
jgi:phospholipase A1/A2